MEFLKMMDVVFPKSVRVTKVRNRGFSLLELVITMFIIVLLASIALPIYQRTIQHTRETILKDTLFTLRKQIDLFASDKGRLPKNLDDLVTEKYIREKPTDPITDEAEWDEIQGEDPNSREGEQGLVDVKSRAQGEDSSGKSYSEY